MEWAINPIKRLVIPITSIPLWHTLIYLAKPIVLVAYRVHGWIILLMAFLPSQPTELPGRELLSVPTCFLLVL